MGNKADVIAGMAPLLDRARRERLWLYCSYQALWFAPDELELLQSQGRLLWGAVNWELRPPAERLHELAREVERASAALEEFSSRLAAWGGEV